MITFENGALTTDATLSIADSQAIFQFADYCAQAEQERIIKLLEGIDTETELWFTEDIIALIKGEN